MNPQMKHAATSPDMAELAAELPHIIAAIKNPVPFFLTGLAAMWAGVHTGQNVPLTLAYTVFAYLLSLLAVIDLRHGILPHVLTGLLATIGALIAPTLGLTYAASTIGALVAFGGLGLCALITGFLTGKPALGGGDLWLTLGLGAWLGTMGLPMLLVATTVTGVISIILKRLLTQNLPTYNTGGQGGGQFPFGPALCAAGWLALLYAPAYWQAIAAITGL